LPWLKLELQLEARLQVLRDNLNKIKMEFVADTTVCETAPSPFWDVGSQYNPTIEELQKECSLI
jgi:hypothetical protein